MKTQKRLILVSLMILGCFIIEPVSAVDCYWNNTGGDNLWSNPNNWKNGNKPGSNDVDKVYLGNDCPDVPQTIILDEPAWIYAIYCTASGNRHYTITPVADETIRIGYYYGLNGSAARTVDLTINAEVLIASDYLRVYCYGGGLTTLNGTIGPSPSERTSSYLAPYTSTGWLVLGASNNISEIRSGAGTKIILNHPQAADYAGFIYSSCQTILVQTNNVTLKRLHPYGAALELGVHESLAGQDVSMDIGYANIGHTITTLPRSGNETFTINLTGASTQGASWSLAADTILRMTNSIQWGILAYPTWGFISGEGQVLCEGTVTLSATNTYSGGTIIRCGQVTLKAADRLPTNGALTIESAGVLYMESKSQQMSELHGDGTIIFSWKSSSTPATNSVTTLLAPGVDGPGTLTFTQAGSLILEDTTTARFELDALSATNDQVKLASSTGCLTLAGKLEIINLGGIEAGDYTLFDLNGGTITGEFAELILPPGVDGTVEVLNGDVVLRTVLRKGSLIMIR